MGLLPITTSTSDFRTIRENEYLYVDKTHLISEMVHDANTILLFPRPRRFGKTLNMTTMQAFFERKQVGHEDLTHLFEGLSVWKDEKARTHFQKHSVIFLSLKDVKERTWKECLQLLIGQIQQVCAQFKWLISEAHLDEAEQPLFMSLWKGTAEKATYETTLRFLSTVLHRVTGEQVVILIDEYDTPIHESHVHGYYDESIQFFRNFLSAGLKDNPHLYKGVLTGILRVAREGMFSGLNNIVVHSILSDQYSDCFGFTDDEVVKLVEQADLSSRMDEIRSWYNGYMFGETVIYNPFSILHYLNDKKHELRPHWVNSGSPDLLVKLVPNAGQEFLQDLEVLLHGETVEKRIDENLVLRELGTSEDALWNLMLFSGYLKPASTRLEAGKRYTQLAIPNCEVHTGYEDIFRSWARQTWSSAGSGTVETLIRHMLKGEVEPFEEMLQKLVATSLSYHDTGKTPEQTYQAFIVGLLVLMQSTHLVRSNRESGYGRADVLIIPKQKNQPGVVIECKKVTKKETAEQALEAAIKQIDERRYVNELEEAGATPIQKYALVFEQKRVWVRKE